ncbi:spore coat protein [Cohnella zeiphila]|uniref:Spore coat protein n=1 Tax=Cohnella zeiphila TaxID=2761120 RepID=A0A7X0SMJ9_9BACL|nr:spore coat protein [Cohnella zeiphila]MBB6732763.1 spore coat protein [Cohnella zeiphila]
MNRMIEYLTGMNVLTDQVIATDLLIAAKSGVRNYAMAVTETTSPEIRQTLIRQLDEAIDMHEQMVNYMIGKDWYHPWDAEEQLRLDLKNAETALNLH